MSEPAKPLSFRLRSSLHDVLAARAEAAGESPAEFARRLVVAALEDQATDQLLLDNRTLRADVSKLSRDVAVLRRQFEAVTRMFVANHFDEKDEDVQAWLKQTFSDRGAAAAGGEGA